MLTLEVITAIMVIGLLVLICLPLSLYFLLKYISIKNSPIVSNRQPHLTIFTCIALILLMSFQTTFSWIPLFFSNDTKTYYLLITIQQCLYPFSAHAAIYGFCARLWITRHIFKIAIAQQNKKWKQYINSKFANIIILRPINNYEKWIGKRMLIIYTISSSLSSILFFIAYSFKGKYISYNIAHTMDLALYLIPFFSFFIIWHFTPRFQDNIFLRKEVRLLIIIMTLMFISYLINIIWNVLDPTNRFISRLWSTCNVVFVCFGTCYVQTQWLYLKIMKLTNTDNDEIQMIQLHIGLLDILKDNEGFDVFMDHLSREFSSEILLSFVEFHQYREMLETDQFFAAHIEICKLQHNDNKNGAIHLCDIILPDRIPKSEIIYGHLTSPSSPSSSPSSLQSVLPPLNGYKCSDIITKLYHKYIAEDSEFCINICDANRGFIKHWIKTNNIKNDDDMTNDKYYEMYHMFDNCCIEIYQLISHSWYRFINTEACRTLINQISNK